MIYLVEDDDSIRELVAYTLQNTGFEALGFSCGSDFWAAVKQRLPSLALLDIMLPGEDGLAILKRLRGSPGTAKLPVMMLTAKGTEFDRVLGLDLGADDYLPKPFGMMEMVARVKNLLRRSGAGESKNEYNIEGLSVSVPKHAASIDGEEISLTLKEFDLLVYLMSNAGIVLTRDQILSSVWDYDFGGETRTVDVHIRTLRSKLGGLGGLIQTVRGVGYRIGGAR
ncbi:MAG: response regulator transcription factor [Synergistaceae bacterium]|jgi:two-component system alkaline phosphatase synthesis response regulator PhoP|nr:response regulator transcription factor [Synergistaceae bacterium]